MIVAKKWAAAGSTAALLAGGFFLGAPAASAAPGDAACLAASTQFNDALGAAGIDVAFVDQLEAAVAKVVAATANLLEVSTTLNLDGLSQEFDDAALAAATIEDEVVAAQDAVAEAVEVSTVLDEAGQPDPESDPAVIAARVLEADALDRLDAAEDAAEAAAASYNAALESEPYVAAEQAALEAADEADALAAQIGGDADDAAALLELFKDFLAACDASTIGVDPVVSPTPVIVAPAPVVVVPETVVVPVAGTNAGLNVQTAVVEKDHSSAVMLLAALLAAGVAVPAATAARMRRLERAQR